MNLNLDRRKTKIVAICKLNRFAQIGILEYRNIGILGQYCVALKIIIIHGETVKIDPKTLIQTLKLMHF